jgi:hypothetical protein
MAEENKPDPEQLIKPKELNDYLEGEKKVAEKRKELALKYSADLRNNEQALAYFSAFDPASVDAFIEHYASEKSKWMHGVDSYATWNEQEQTRWVDEAFKRLKEIQQKKLFDVQCHWRAEKTEIEEIKICSDFRTYWEGNVMNCPFIEPVTQEDINLYIQYLQSGNFEEYQDLFAGWQDYEDIKEAYNTENANRNFPEWYDFYNGRKGTAVFMLFPDIRGQKEKEYLDLYHAEAKELIEKRMAETPCDTRPPFTNYPHSHIPWFVETFEDKLTQHYMQAFKDLDEEDNDAEDDDNEEYNEESYINVENIFFDLEREMELIPIEDSYDYREALQLAWNKYTIKKIIESLPQAFEQYQFHIQTGLAFEDKYLSSKTEARDMWRNNLLRGRELKGEPRDFNF